MFRRRPYRQRPSVHRYGHPQGAIPVQPDHGPPRRHPGHHPTPGRPGGFAAARLALAGDRHQPQSVAAGGDGDHHGRQRPCRPRGQLLRWGGEDGEEQCRGGRESRAHDARARARGGVWSRCESPARTRSPATPGAEPRAVGNVGMTEVKAELVGNVWKITAKPGDDVAEDDVLLILESMKMEISVTAPRAGKVKEIRVKETDVVKEGQVLVVLE